MIIHTSEISAPFMLHCGHQNGIFFISQNISKIISICKRWQFLNIHYSTRRKRQPAILTASTVSHKTLTETSKENKQLSKNKRQGLTDRVERYLRLQNFILTYLSCLVSLFILISYVNNNLKDCAGQMFYYDLSYQQIGVILWIYSVINCYLRLFKKQTEILIMIVVQIPIKIYLFALRKPFVFVNFVLIVRFIVDGILWDCLYLLLENYDQLCLHQQLKDFLEYWPVSKASNPP